jgi:ArsR family transcriptional regulator, arsenate/arsenite/antimonite-responsive transcriptional repressor
MVTSTPGLVGTLEPDAPQPCCPPLANAPVTAEVAAEFGLAFKALGDPVRLRLLSMIAAADGGEVCVCELTPGFEKSAATISHHLKLLRDAGLVTSQRRGTWVYYRAVSARLAALTGLLAAMSSS